MKTFLALVRSRLRSAVRLGVLGLVVATADGQTSRARRLLLVTSDDTHLIRSSHVDGYGRVARGEVVATVPRRSGTFAELFLTHEAQLTYLGDADGDGAFSLLPFHVSGNAIDALFLKRFPLQQSAVGSRDLYVSVDSSQGLGGLVGDATVFRFAGEGVADVFLTDQQLEAALPFNGTDVDLKAICQDHSGNLYVSVWKNDPGPFEQTGLYLIPAASITYDVDGDVAAIQGASAVRIAEDADVCAWIVNSGFRDPSGMVPHAQSGLCLFSSFSGMSLSALELDPSGGTWTSPLDGAAHPNLMFGWEDASNGVGLVSTRNGGSIPLVNGVPMASRNSTQGFQAGLAPGYAIHGFAPGLAGVALDDLTPPSFTLRTLPRFGAGVPSTEWRLELQAADAGPNAPVVYFWSLVSDVPGSAPPETLVLPPFTGALYGTPPHHFLGAQYAESSGVSQHETRVPPWLVGTGKVLSFQAYDLLTRTFSTPSTIQF